MPFKIPTGGNFASVIFLAAFLGACDGIPGAKDIPRLADASIEDRSRDITRTSEEAVNFFAEKPTTLLESSGANAFKITTDGGQDVPRVSIGEINAAPMEFGALLNQIAGQVDMSWRITGPGKSDLMSEEVFFVQRSETMLETVLDQLSEATGAFYRVEGDRIIFTQDRHFVVRVPRMANSQDVMVDGLGNVGATDIFQDQLSGTVSFRATQPAFEGARKLVESLEAGRDMVVYDFWIIDRNLSDTAGIGANLTANSSDENQGINLTGAQLIQTIASGGSASGFINGNLGDFGVEATVRFLRSLGETETVARPTISMLSGGESTFSSGEKSEYIRSVNTSTSIDESETLAGTDVRGLETGVKISVTGAHNAGVISTDFTVEVSELLSFEEFDTGSVTLRLPKTSERKLEAHLEARPGDVMILGGIIRDRQVEDATEISGTGVPTSRSRQAEKTETIILVRPRLVQIRPVEGARSEEQLRIGSGIGVIRTPNPMAAVLEEEARALRVTSDINR
jgi:hypothetical protein